MADSNTPLLGIDLGTTFSCIANMTDFGPAVYTDPISGNPTVPSVVYLAPGTTQYVVGEAAAAQSFMDPDNVKRNVKRDMHDIDKKIIIGGKPHTPVTISSKILRHLYQGVLERYPPGVCQPLGVVITYPYYFKAHQIQNTEAAAKEADLPVLGLLQEPVAATLMYVHSQNPADGTQETVLTFDLGGGTFDVTVSKLTSTNQKLTIEVITAGGDDFLGGMDFDEALQAYVVEKEGVDFSKISDEAFRKQAQQNLNKVITDTKEKLASIESYALMAPYLPTAKGPNLVCTITRAELDKTVAGFAARVTEIVLKTCMTAGVIPRRDIDGEEIQKLIEDKGLAGLETLGVGGAQLDRVIKVGGSSKMIFFHNLLVQLFGADKIYAAKNVDHAVAEGAAIYAAYLFDPGSFTKEIEIININAHAFGVEVRGGAFSQLIPANAPLPARGSRVYGTSKDNQKELTIAVYQGDKPQAADNTRVGFIRVEGLTPRPRGEADIRITFEMLPTGIISAIVDVKQDGLEIMEMLDTNTRDN